jgi:hypothetical protein
MKMFLAESTPDIQWMFKDTSWELTLCSVKDGRMTSHQGIILPFIATVPDASAEYAFGQAVGGNRTRVQ